MIDFLDDVPDDHIILMAVQETSGNTFVRSTYKWKGFSENYNMLTCMLWGYMAVFCLFQPIMGF